MCGSSKQKIAITSGDPAGVGPELVEGWVAGHLEVARGSVVVIGPADWLSRPVFSEVEKEAVGAPGFLANPGHPGPEGAAAALEAMERAASGCAEGRFAAVVTGPVSKIQLRGIGYRFPGQTEFFAARWGGDPVMAFCGGSLRVALATWHIPLKDVPVELNEKKLVRAIEQAEVLGKIDGVAHPRIAVCGLNPHAGEEGMLGDEEKEWINPLLAKLAERLKVAPVAQPGDTVFQRALQSEFDVVVALYHDQGLAPLKAVAFEESVNVTLGLPYLRVSPDHGTAFSLAGKGTASGRSLARAIDLALTRRH